MIPYIKLFRVHQWVKNLFVFLPLFFSGHLFDTYLLWESIYAFAVFSLLASLIYVINDFKDLGKDRLHDEKKTRPLASGAIAPRNAFLGCIPIAILLCFLCVYKFSPMQLVPLGIYFLLNLAYTLGLKSIAILDIGIIAIGFVLRVIFGGVVTGIEVSKWAFLLTFSLALVLALGKRRGELMVSHEGKRASLTGYNLAFIDAALISSVTITIVCYIMYSIAPSVEAQFGFSHLYATSLFVILGVFRYLQQTFVYQKTESPTKLIYKDPFIQINILLWILSFGLIIYNK